MTKSRKEYQRAWRKANPDKIQAYRHAPQRPAYYKAYYRAHREEKLAYDRRRKYGVFDYTFLLERQGGGCAGCGSKPNGKMLLIDHDHETGRVRGLLCHPCNLAVNRHITPETLRRLASYLGGASK